MRRSSCRVTRSSPHTVCGRHTARPTLRPGGRIQSTAVAPARSKPPPRHTSPALGSACNTSGPSTASAVDYGPASRVPALAPLRLVRCHSGACSSLPPRAYFAEEQRLSRGATARRLNALLRAAAGKQGGLPIAKLLAAAGGPQRAAVMTDRFCRLREVTTCWAKAEDGSVGAQVDCPPHVLRGGRNNSGSTGCESVHVDSSAACSFISKQALRALRGRP